MKKFLGLVLVLMLAFSLTACGKETKGEGVMTYDEYIAAKIDDKVVIEAHVQAKQSWWNNSAVLYLQDKEGAYFVYGVTCTEDQYETDLAIGNKIRVSGYKTSYRGEVEIASGATYELLSGKYKAKAKDVTKLFGTDDLIKYQNFFISIKGVEVVGRKGEGDATVPFTYGWDGSGSREGNSDLYFTIKIGENNYDMCVESYLCSKDTDVYKAVEALKIGDTVNLEGFLYWYDGANPHITSCKVK